MVSDFQIENDYNYIFKKLLEERLADINGGNYEKRNKNEYCLNINEDNSNGLLYTTIDEKKTILNLVIFHFRNLIQLISI